MHFGRLGVSLEVDVILTFNSFDIIKEYYFEEDNFTFLHFIKNLIDICLLKSRATYFSVAEQGLGPWPTHCSDWKLYCRRELETLVSRCA